MLASAHCQCPWNQRGDEPLDRSVTGYFTSGYAVELSRFSWLRQVHGPGSWTGLKEESQLSINTQHTLLPDRAPAPGAPVAGACLPGWPAPWNCEPSLTEAGRFPRYVFETFY